MSVDKSNIMEIELAFKTMEWLYSLDDTEIPDDVNMRDLGLNIQLSLH